MEDKIKNWPQTNKRFVAFMDILGFKDWISRDNNVEIYNKLAKFQPELPSMWKTLSSILDAWKTPKDTNRHDDMRLLTFSDSIVIYSKSNNSKSMMHILEQTSLTMLLAIYNGIPIKGSISYGLQTADFENNLHFGVPLIDAYQLQDELLLYGVVIHNTMEKYLIEKDELNFLIKSKLIIDIPVPMKSGEINHYMLNWPVIIQDSDFLSSRMSELRCRVSGSPRRYVDNTLKFINIAKEKGNS